MNWFVPGRIEVFGKHTDYAGGRSLLAAIDRGITASITPAGQGITVSSAATKDTLTLQAGIPNPAPVGHWSHYVQTVVDRLSNNFGPIRPGNLRIESDLPLASGMSSSSAFIVATALALADHSGFTEIPSWQNHITSRVDLAGYLACVENGLSFGELAGQRGVGTFGGSEDHTAMLCCDRGRISKVRFCPIVVEESVRFDDQWCFVVAVSGVRAEKTGAAKDLYNQVSILARQLVEIWNQHTDSRKTNLAEVLRSPDDPVGRLEQFVGEDPDLRGRLRAFVTESEVLIPAATAALRDGNYTRFGELALESHRNASRLLRNQTRETDRLVELATNFGAVGASGFGAGFGGSVWALVEANTAEAFARSWLGAYRLEFPKHRGTATSIITRPSSSAHRI